MRVIRLSSGLILGALFVSACGTEPAVSPVGGGGPGKGGGGAGGTSGGGQQPMAPGGGATGGAAGPGVTPGAPPSMGMNCGVKKVDLQARPADLLLVLDRSRSMLQSATSTGNGGGGGGTGMAQPGSRWVEVVTAIDPVVMRTQEKVAWGLKLYPMGETCGVPDGATVPIGLNNHGPLLGAIRGNDPGVGSGGSTPTRVAVQKATTFMTAHPSPNAKHLVLATDGLPNCGGRSGGGGGGDDANGAIQAVAAANMAGIPVFVVGVATAGTEAHETLNQMATMGGRPRNDATKYYPVASRDELVTVLESIAGQVASCTFPLDPAPPVPENVAVEVDGMRVNRDPAQQNGWNYGPNNRSIVLFGSICESLKAGSAKAVQILYGCPGEIIK